MKNGITAALNLDLLPQNLAAEMTLEVTLDRPEVVDELSNEMKIADVPIPGAAVVIKEIFALGLRAQFLAGFTTRLRGGIKYKAGLSAALPGSPRITLDAIQLDKNGAEGFDGFHVAPKMSLKSLSATADFSLAARPKLVFGIDIIDKIQFEISLIINLPELKGTCTAKYRTWRGRELNGFHGVGANVRQSPKACARKTRRNGRPAWKWRPKWIWNSIFKSTSSVVARRGVHLSINRNSG